MPDFELFEGNVKKTLKMFRQDNTILIFAILLIVVIGLSLLAGFIFYNKIENNDVIQQGVYIKGIDVSNLSVEDAKTRVSEELKSRMNDHIVLTYNDIEYYVEIEQIEAKFDIDSAVEYAFNLSKKGNMFEDITQYISILLTNVNIDLDLVYNDGALTRYIEEIQALLPDQLSQASYYMEDDKLIVTNGNYGAEIDTLKLKNSILYAIQDISYNSKSIEIPTTIQYPDPINVLAIHNDIYKKVSDAYFTKDPYAVFAEKVGVDFSVNELMNKISNDSGAEEYVTDLIYTYPEVTVQDLGQEAFPDLLGSYSTKYVNNADRTINLRLASNKIDGFVLMPGETFSYNQTVGKRTISAGYKNAAIYENGEVIDGIGGGVCQISSTLYNAVIAADLEIMERHNHSFVSTYVPAGQDATVAWGSLDFKFKNNRDYPIKISSSVSNGIASAKIYGLRREVEYDQKLETRTIKNTSKSLVVESYRVLSMDGREVSRRRIYTDTYKKH